ncbi:MAG: c-type cytochrome biogenesis protein CcmI [Pyrinomonadaceae bacterium]|nr:c-type cytochrome biogenesis protein CcmI [Pyrinomonadaceae bacterium]
MITFLVLAALLIGLALLFLLPPLLQGAVANDGGLDAVNISIYKDRLAELENEFREGQLRVEEYEQERRELELRLLEDVPPATGAGATLAPPAAQGSRGLALAAGLALPALAALLYVQLGTPQAFSTISTASQTAPPIPSASASAQPERFSQEGIENMVKALAARLEKDPNDAQGWTMLGRSYTSMGRYAEASNAYAKATALDSQNSALWVDYADTLAMASGERLAGKPVELINKALALDPNNHKALALAGSAAFEMENYPQAVTYWKRLQQLLPADSEMMRNVSAGIEQAQRLASGNKAP